MQNETKSYDNNNITFNSDLTKSYDNNNITFNSDLTFRSKHRICAEFDNLIKP